MYLGPKIIYIQNLKVYEGQSTYPQHRYCWHMKNPPTKMKKDVLKYKPFEHNFKFELLHG
jgi:hypothetical protein